MLFNIKFVQVCAFAVNDVQTLFADRPCLNIKRLFFAAIIILL